MNKRGVENKRKLAPKTSNGCHTSEMRPQRRGTHLQNDSRELIGETIETFLAVCNG